MDDLPLYLQIILQTAPSIATPIIAGALTIWGVIIAANRADTRREQDQTDADERRKADQLAEEERRRDDLDKSERERQRQITIESNQRQLRIVAEFVSSVRQSERQLHDAIGQLANTKIPTSLLSAVNVDIQLGKEYLAYSEHVWHLYESWQLLYLSVVDPVVFKQVNNLIPDIDRYDSQVRNFKAALDDFKGSVGESPLAQPEFKRVRDATPIMGDNFGKHLITLLKTSRERLNQK